ncbi:SCP2 sterol-binding domain-containing protein [Tropicimonas isoalkanivorans]|uniref:SCP-2 sterol transfer family protein n=1 Tax=Tropicimonas isoalkanivorans TaxID=441112 RepID=A0A1I1LRY8_9RHOB|nr:SCP2 sterol-binding domain-containing protein [Tropicimonas isoalkanivorans]SFC72210.1 SCP-2 sterol transfer family protein [Tropicimonas isoalkanivorans]
MSEMIDKAVAALSARLNGPVNGTAKFVIEDEGSLIIDEAGVRKGDADADVTLKADADTFRSILDGETNPTVAFMTGKLSVEGDMGLAMQLGAALS